MKKLFICSAAVAMLAGCSSKPETVPVFDANCEKVAVFEQGDMIVKCPVIESLAAIQAQEPTAKFVQGGEVDFVAAAADAEHIYVNVIPAGAYEWAEKLEYRVMVKEPNFEGDAMWAVSVVVE